MDKQKEKISFEEKYNALLKENKKLKEKLQSSEAKQYGRITTKNDKEKQKIWNEIMDYLILDPERVKRIIRRAIIDKVLDVNEKSPNDQTLLMLLCNIMFILFDLFVVM